MNLKCSFGQTTIQTKKKNSLLSLSLSRFIGEVVLERERERVQNYWHSCDVLSVAIYNPYFPTNNEEVTNIMPLLGTKVMTGIQIWAHGVIGRLYVLLQLPPNCVRRHQKAITRDWNWLVSFSSVPHPNKWYLTDVIL